MKYPNAVIRDSTYQSLPARGVWIEILIQDDRTLAHWSLPARGVWIEIPQYSTRPR